VMSLLAQGLSREKYEAHLGLIIQAGAGQITARQAAIKGGIPMTTPGMKTRSSGRMAQS